MPLHIHVVIWDFLLLLRDILDKGCLILSYETRELAIFVTPIVAKYMSEVLPPIRLNIVFHSYLTIPVNYIVHLWLRINANDYVFKQNDHMLRKNILVPIAFDSTKIKSLTYV